MLSAFVGASVQSGELSVSKARKITRDNTVSLFIWLSGSGFWGWNVMICGIYETFLGITCVLPRSTVANYKQCESPIIVSNNWRHAASQGCMPVATLWEDVHSSGEKFICSGENILHHQPTEIPALPEQTSKYSNEHLVRTPNQQYVHFFFSDIRLCSRIFWHSRIERHTRNARNSWRPRAATTRRKRWSWGGGT